MKNLIGLRFLVTIYLSVPEASRVKNLRMSDIRQWAVESICRLYAGPFMGKISCSTVSVNRHGP